MEEVEGVMEGGGVALEIEQHYLKKYFKTFYL
jgi:hypothetical protein